jgi:phage baseplate assembly protein W
VLIDQLSDNLRNLILTNWGERLGNYGFGANLRPLMSDLVSLDDFDTQAIGRIKAAVSRWMPYIDLQDFTSSIDRTQNKNTAVVQLTITYNVPSLKIKDKKLQVALYAI